MKVEDAENILQKFEGVTVINELEDVQKKSKWFTVGKRTVRYHRY